MSKTGSPRTAQDRAAIGARITLRDAGPGDAAAIAALHAASWRSAYRGILTDLYLDGPVAAERDAVWRRRLSDPAPNQIVVLADLGGRLAGFACCFAAHDPRLGSLVDNLHAAPGSRGLGLGPALLHAVGRRLAATAPDRPVHLDCLDDNRPAMRFYGRIGGRPIARQRKREPDGTLCAATTFTWDTPAGLAAATETHHGP